jgi:hypothetical protein
MQLLGDKSLDPVVRESLLHSLCSTGVPSGELAAAVRPSLHDPNDHIRYYAACYLLESEADSALAIQQLLEAYEKWARDPSPSVRQNVSFRIVRSATRLRDSERPPFVAILRRIEQDGNAIVREAAAQAVRKLSNCEQ